MPIDIVTELNRIGLRVHPEAAAKLSRYLDLLEQWNKKVNLVGPQDRKTVLTTLVADSIPLASFLENLPVPESPQTMDLGAGAGLPGIPLRVLWTRGEYWMVEPRMKRAAFLRRALQDLGLERTSVLAERVEHLPEETRRADLVLARAFLPWREYLAVARGVVRPGGMVLVFAREPQPEAVPQEWELFQVQEYRLGERVRYFWSFSPVSAPS